MLSKWKGEDKEDGGWKVGGALASCLCPLTSVLRSAWMSSSRNGHEVALKPQLFGSQRFLDVTFGEVRAREADGLLRLGMGWG